jgi:hypothetical protein
MLSSISFRRVTPRGKHASIRRVCTQMGRPDVQADGTSGEGPNRPCSDRRLTCSGPLPRDPQVFFLMSKFSPSSSCDTMERHHGEKEQASRQIVCASQPFLSFINFIMSTVRGTTGPVPSARPDPGPSQDFFARAPRRCRDCASLPNGPQTSASWRWRSTFRPSMCLRTN